MGGGILELDDPDFKKKKNELDKGWKPYRINHLSWWKEELSSECYIKNFKKWFGQDTIISLLFLMEC